MRARTSGGDDLRKEFESDRLTVLHSLRAVRPTTNPYLVMLREGLRAHSDIDFLDFSYRTAILGRFDVFHVHWPEILLEGRGWYRRIARQLLLVLFLLRLRWSGVPVVRTVHNVERPEGLRRHENLLLDWIDRLTVLRIRLNAHTSVGNGQVWAEIPHGHYRDWFSSLPRRRPVEGRLGYFGLIRRYKGVESLLSAFRGTQDTAAGPALSLRVGGKPSSAELADLMLALARQDDRVSLDLRYLSDADLVELVAESEVVVLPYRLMHNSGGVLTALSLDRPVLVPDNAVNRSLGDEVGPGWVHTFDDELTAEDLLRALRVARTTHGRPDLSRREWSSTSDQHVAAYRRAAKQGRHRRRRRGGPAEVE